MYSQSFMARDIFGPYWCLVLLGALVESSPPFHSFDAAMRAYAERVEPARRALLQHVRELGVFDDDVMEIAETDSWWREDPKDPPAYDADMLAALVTVACEGPELVHLDTREQLVAECTRAARRQISRLLSAFMPAVHVAGLTAQDAAPLCARLFELSAEIAGPALSDIALARILAEDFSEERYADADGDPAYIEWERAAARHLALLAEPARRGPASGESPVPAAAPDAEGATKQGEQLRQRLVAQGWAQRGDFLFAPLESMHLHEIDFQRSDLTRLLEDMRSRRRRILATRELDADAAAISLADVEPLLSALEDIVHGRHR